VYEQILWRPPKHTHIKRKLAESMLPCLYILNFSLHLYAQESRPIRLTNAVTKTHTSIRCTPLFEFNKYLDSSALLLWSVLVLLQLHILTELSDTGLFMINCNIVETKRTDVVATLKTRIQKMSGTNLGRDTSYPNSGFSWFYSGPPHKYQDNTSIKPELLAFKSHPIQQSSIILLFDVIWPSYWHSR
jgi:hypothetical protein